MVLAKGDTLTVTGEKNHLKALAEELGTIELNVQETDLVVLSFGIVFGLVAGTLLLKLGPLEIGLGSAGGLLLMGILVGALRTSFPAFGRVPAAARFIFMELGLMFFMASVGLKAGKGIIDALTAVGPTLIVIGFVVTLTPVIVGYLFGRHVLKLNPALLLGSITGAMTSTPSLSIVTKAANSSIPALGYAGTYTFANVFLTFAGTLLMTIW
jgi:putative transport protein